MELQRRVELEILSGESEGVVDVSCTEEEA
jgi:hypothetical protein